MRAPQFESARVHYGRGDDSAVYLHGDLGCVALVVLVVDPHRRLMVQLTFLPPTKPWSTNDERRMHWAVRARTVKAWREAAAWAARAARVRSLPSALVTVTVPFSRGGRRDPMNYVGTIVKATVDGLVDAGCWPDDTAEFVEIRQPALEVGTHVIVTITAR